MSAVGGVGNREQAAVQPEARWQPGALPGSEAAAAPRLRLLVYGLNYAPELTATGKYTGEMAAWLAARGHRVEAIAAPPHYPEWRVHEAYRHPGFRREELEGVRVYRAPLFVPAPDCVSARNRILMECTYTASALRWWLPVLLSRRHDAVIAVCPPLQVGLYPWLYRCLRGVPWVFHLQDLQVDAALRLGIWKTRRLARVAYGVEGFLLRRATRVSTITEAMRRRLLAKGVPEERTWLFPNWADTDHIRPLPADNPFRAGLCPERERVVVMHAGNMGEKQGLELVLEAAAALREDPRLLFVLVGDGAARARLEKMAAGMGLQNVRFLPLQPRERLPQVLASADIHLVVQRAEAAEMVMPSKLANILAAGRPCVATAEVNTTLHEVLSRHGTGLATPPGEVGPFARAIQQLAAAPAQREEMGRNARAYAERYLEKEQVLRDFEARLLSLVHA